MYFIKSSGQHDDVGNVLRCHIKTNYQKTNEIVFKLLNI